MKDGRDKSGLNVISEKPVNKSQFALMNQMQKEYEQQQIAKLNQFGGMISPSQASVASTGSKKSKQLTSLGDLSSKGPSERRATAVLHKMPAGQGGSKAALQVDFGVKGKQLPREESYESILLPDRHNSHELDSIKNGMDSIKKGISFMLGSGSGSGQHYLINHKYVHETSDVR